MHLQRRSLFALLGTLLLAACAIPTPWSTEPPPIVFVHGNGDSAALWQTTIWRFESNGWPADRLVALDMPNPLARDDDTQPQVGRSSTREQAEYLAAQVDKVLTRTGAKQVVLMGNSRGGYAIRNYIRNYGGDERVSAVVLGGVPNHGVWAIADFRPNNEFNGAGPFLKELNAPQGPNGDEVTPGPRWLTIRSDHEDKYAQPDGAWIGAKGKPTNVGYDGPALKGADNEVLPGRDHRETAFHPQAFALAYRFITGHAPKTLDIVPATPVVLNGKISGIGPAGPDNLPLVGAEVDVYAVDAATGARQGEARHHKVIGIDGLWGPFQAAPDTAYEFVISAESYATTHIYRSPFPRSSNIVDMRALRLPKDLDGAVAVISLSRPRGYFGLPRDHVVFDGIDPAPGIPPGVPGVSTSTLKLKNGAGRSVVGSFDSGSLHERIAGIAWPAAQNQITVLELTQ